MRAGIGGVFHEEGSGQVSKTTHARALVVLEGDPNGRSLGGKSEKKRNGKNELVLSSIVEPTMIDANGGKAYRKRAPSRL
jgi:hypothetical protein